MPYTDFGHAYDAAAEGRLEVTVEEADAYFKPENHREGQAWDGLDDETAKQGLLTQAQRELELTQGRIMVTPDSTDQLGPRDDYAVFEQALFLLENAPRTSGMTPAVDLSRSGKKKQAMLDRTGIPISPKAQRFLNRNRLKIGRG